MAEGLVCFAIASPTTVGHMTVAFVRGSAGAIDSAIR